MPNSIQLVMLDKASLDNDDLDFSDLESLELDIKYFNHSANEQVNERIKHADIVITNKAIVDAAAIQQSKKLKLICVSATGVNNIDLEAAKRYLIEVNNVMAYATPSVVQHVFMLITNLNTNFQRYQSALNNNRWSESSFFCLLDFPITDLANQTLGVIGYGELGKAVVSVARAFGMKVLIAESFVAKQTTDICRVSLNEVLAQSDVISLHCPLTEQTQNLITAKELKLMKRTALLINTARGGIVNEKDLLFALQNKIIRGAGLDVLEQEPPVREHPLLTAKLDNLIVTPHIAWASRASRQRLLDGVVCNIRTFLQHKDIN